MGSAHLATRFFRSLRARRTDAADVAWVQLVLTPEEFTVWETLGRADRAESLGTARELARLLGPDVEDLWLAAAMCHDVGKTDARLGTFGRVGATLVAGVVSHGRARHMSNRIGRYINHDDLGAGRLAQAGARPEVTAWAAAHHRRERWPSTGIPVGICELLAAADGE